MGAILFVIALIIYIYKCQSDNKRMKDVMRRNDADPYSHSKSDNWYKQHPEEKVINHVLGRKL